MARYSAVLGFALGAVAFVAGTAVLSGMTDRHNSCSPDAWIGGSTGSGAAVCADVRPVTRLVAMPGDRSVAPTADGRGVRVSLQSDADAAGLDRPWAETEAGGDILSRTPTTSGLFDLPSLISSVRASRPDLPVFADEPAREVVVTSPDLAWAEGAFHEQWATAPATEETGAFVPAESRAPVTAIPAVAAGSAANADGAGARIAASAGVSASRDRLHLSRLRAGHDPEGATGTPASTERAAAGTSPLAAGQRVAASPQHSGRQLTRRLQQPTEPAEEEPMDVAEAVVETETAVAEASAAEAAPPLVDLGRVVLRAGEHPTFSRMVFDWPQHVDYSVTDEGDTVRITFPIAARIDSDRARRMALSRVRDFDIRQTDDGLVFTITKAGPAAAETFRLDNRVVIDIAA